MSQKLFLVRHARAEAQNPGGDAARQLSEAGRTAFEAHARALRPILEVDRIVTSPLTRARETAQILAMVTGASAAPDVELAAGNCDAHELLRLASRQGAGVALVGHNPEFADAVSMVAGHRVDFPPGAIAALELVGNNLEFSWIRRP